MGFVPFSLYICHDIVVYILMYYTNTRTFVVRAYMPCLSVSALHSLLLSGGQYIEISGLWQRCQQPPYSVSIYFTIRIFVYAAYESQRRKNACAPPFDSVTLARLFYLHSSNGYARSLTRSLSIVSIRSFRSFVRSSVRVYYFYFQPRIEQVGCARNDERCRWQHRLHQTPQLFR